jgi:heptose I phosphotransferase
MVQAAYRTISSMRDRFFIAEGFAPTLAEMGIDSLDSVFSLEGGRDLAKKSIARYRKRIELEATPPGAAHPVKLYLKRYNRPAWTRQVANWFVHRRRVSFAGIERDVITALAACGVNTPSIVAWGCQWGALFERRSFLMTEQVEDSDSLERRLPACFSTQTDSITLRARRRFIRSLANFIRRFHQTGYRHRDLYLSHIFCSTQGQFCLIDLARAFKPLLARRFQIKDLAQLHFSAPAGVFSRTDRLRFYLAYCEKATLTRFDKSPILAILRKARRMAQHNRKHGVPIPFLDGAGARR